jgi:hypothetical protein
MSKHSLGAGGLLVAIVALALAAAAQAGTTIQYTTGGFSNAITWYPGVTPSDNLGITLSGVAGSADLRYGVAQVLPVNGLVCGGAGSGDEWYAIPAVRTMTANFVTMDLSQNWWGRLDSVGDWGWPECYWEIGLQPGSPVLFDLGGEGVLRVTPLGLGPFTVDYYGMTPEMLAEYGLPPAPPAVYPWLDEGVSVPVYAEFLLASSQGSLPSVPEPATLSAFLAMAGLGGYVRARLRKPRAKIN